jgi:hypothetical protein
MAADADEPNRVESLRQSGASTASNGGFLLSEPQCLYIFADQPVGGPWDPGQWQVTVRPLTAGAPPKSCSVTGTIVAEGVGSTDGNGTAEYLLSDFYCLSVAPNHF